MGGGGLGRVREAAGLIGDPPDADYLGDDSVVCTRDEQRVAYALRSLLLGDCGAVTAELRDFPGGRPDDGLAPQAEAVRGLAAGDARRFLGAMADVLASHDRRAARAEGRKDPASYFCLPAAGLARLALATRLVEPGWLPAGSPYLFREPWQHRQVDQASGSGPEPMTRDNRQGP